MMIGFSAVPLLVATLDGLDAEGVGVDRISPAILGGCGSGLGGLGATAPEKGGKENRSDSKLEETPPKGRAPSILRLL